MQKQINDSAKLTNSLLRALKPHTWICNFPKQSNSTNLRHNWTLAIFTICNIQLSRQIL